MSAIVEWLVAFWSNVLEPLKWLLDGIIYVFKSVLFFVIDGLLTVVLSIVGSLDVGSLMTNITGVWLGLPTQLIYVINASGVPTGLSMLFYSIVIRKTLDLIPAVFTRF